MLVKDFMTLDPKTVSPTDDAATTLDLMRSLNFRQCPVVENGNLVGIVTDRNLRTALAAGGNPIVKEIMAANPVTIIDYTSIEGAAEIIRSGKFNALPVVNSRNELVGILTVTDLLDALLKMMGFHEKPVRLEVRMLDETNMFDILHAIQQNSDKVISFSVAPEDRKLYYFWVVNCNFGELEKALREDSIQISTVVS
ncbi:MAG: CBS domain-containing protein [Candidatus Dadabacteria bacterium]|nr:CBS domain-containing protein [Candidatus Dadabacteria bacterium]